MAYPPRPRRTLQQTSLLVAMFVFVLQTMAWAAMPFYTKHAEDGWVSICTSEGIKWISLTQTGIARDAPPQPLSSTMVGDRCDLCVFAHGLGMAPPASPLWTHDSVVRILAVYTTSPVALSVQHDPQQARAPPVHELI